jgi:ubiquinone/menaquinone biosynthesis C-methylase UbiE
MFREIVHFVRHAPGTLALKRRVTQADLYETVMARADEAGLAQERAALVRGLRGHVLEVGAGTGAMFRHYEAGVDLVALEPEAGFSELARPKARSAACSVELVDGSAERMPFADGAFDGVVVALTLCSIPDVALALSEIARIARPGAPIRLIEHVKSPRVIAGALMSLFDPLWLALNGQGCHMNRDAEGELARAGFVVDDVRPFQIFAAGLPAFPMRRIDAHVGTRSRS